MFTQIPEYPNYMINVLGTVVSNYPNRKRDTSNALWKPLVPVLDKGTGYFLVTLIKDKKRKNCRIHRLLMLTFVPNPNNLPHINHIDGNKLNNSLDNLEWCTSKYNAQHALRLGKYEPVFEKSRVAVNQICPITKIIITRHQSLHDVFKDTGISWQNVWKVCNGKRKTAGGFIWEYAK